CDPIAAPDSVTPSALTPAGSTLLPTAAPTAARASVAMKKSPYFHDAQGWQRALSGFKPRQEIETLRRCAVATSASA
ncbi:hypothetical protein, partial [Frankia sp. AgW1.1]|uniref:hypothetical protein n=1 Tax=Frankia sp. AgW1.1 TaxID=1836971 RepID=UPI001EE4C3E4